MEKYLGEPVVCLMSMFLEPLDCGSSAKWRGMREYIQGGQKPWQRQRPVTTTVLCSAAKGTFRQA